MMGVLAKFLGGKTLAVKECSERDEEVERAALESMQPLPDFSPEEMEILDEHMTILSLGLGLKGPWIFFLLA